MDNNNPKKSFDPRKGSKRFAPRGKGHGRATDGQNQGENKPLQNGQNPQNGQNQQNRQNHQPKHRSGDNRPEAAKKSAEQDRQEQVKKPQNEASQQNREGGKRRRGGRGRGRDKRGDRTPRPEAEVKTEAAAEVTETVELFEPAPAPQPKVSPKEEEISREAAEYAALEVKNFFEAAKNAPDPATVEPEETVEIIGIRFKQSGKVYYFAPGKVKATAGMNVIVETARGVEYGNVVIGNKFVPLREIVPPLRTALRVATAEDEAHYLANAEKEKEAFDVCSAKIAEHKLEMKLIHVEYTFDNNKLLFYFTADSRIDFRDLVKDLASVFRTRIELRQIGIRDEAKMVGGLGLCGRPFCCKAFLNDFVQVSIKMAKEQNMSLNSAKISGACGRLMCCLRYEYDTYDAEIRMTPKVDSIVATPDGEGVVVEATPLKGLIKVRLSSASDMPPKVYHRDDVTVKGFVNKQDKNRGDRKGQKDGAKDAAAKSEEPAGESAEG